MNQEGTILEIIWREIKTYRYIVSFYIKQLLRAELARVAAFGVVTAAVIELLAPLTHLPEFPRLGSPYELALASALLLVAIMGLSSHTIQARAIHQYVSLTRLQCSLPGELGALDFSNPSDREERLHIHVKTVLDSFNEAFGQPKGGKPTIYVAVFRKQPSGDLIRICEGPPTGYHPDGLVPAGQGAVGCVLREGRVIYIPKVSHRHGICISSEAKGPRRTRTMKLVKGAFFQFGDRLPPFQSLLCVPILTTHVNGRREILGVLAIGSTKIGGFSSEFYLDAAQLEASSIASAMEKCYSFEPPCQKQTGEASTKDLVGKAS